MGNWTRVKKGANGGGRGLRMATAVRKNRGDGRRAFFVVPISLTGGKTSARVYQDGPTRFAFEFDEDGDFSAALANGSKNLQAVVLPMSATDLVPYGTTDIPHTIDGGLIVIDLADLAPAVAAE